jgi:hypothetical protein
MKNIIATWTCVDSESTGTYFPSAKGNSSDPRTQMVYWRCAVCFFVFARHYNPSATLALFSNRPMLPEIEDTDMEALLEKLGVCFYCVPFEFITPEHFYKSWRNQFYEFSILKFVSSHKAFSTNDNFLLLDSDCLITADLRSLFESLSEHKCITYIIDYERDYPINGISRLEMKEIFERYMKSVLHAVPDYHGGEFYASTVNVAKQLSDDFELVWKSLLKDHKDGRKKLNEEAHVLSYLFLKNSFGGGQANSFIKRMWTDPSTFRNVQKYDEAFPIWHLPAEKTSGFKTLHHWLKKIEFNLQAVPHRELKEKLSNIFMIPDVPIKKRPYYSTKRAIKKLLSI